MKKYIALVLSTVLIIAGVTVFGNTVISSVPFVTVYKAEPSTIKNTIVCTGKVEYCQSREVHTLTGGTVDKLYVKRGDKVKAGDKLVDVVASASSKDQSTAPMSPQEIYQSVLNGNYSVLDDYDSMLENATQPAVSGLSQTLTAPISGTVEEISFSENEYASPGEIIVSIVSDGNLQVVLPVSEVKISDIKIGQPVVITGSGFKSKYNGKVTSIDDEAKQSATSSGKETTVDVTVSIENPKKDVKSGFTAKCTITSSIKTDALLLPYQSVKAENDGNEYVFIYDNGKAKKKYVKTDGEYAGGLEVITGVKYNDYIITSPESLRNDNTVKLDKTKNKESAVESNA